MKIRTFKTTFLFAFFLMLAGMISAQSLSGQTLTDQDREAEVYATTILDEEKISYEGYNILTKINKAIIVLDERKESGKIVEAEYQKGLNILIGSKDAMNKRALDARLAQMDNAPGQPAEIKKAKGDGIYNLSAKRLKKKLEAGKISQSQYDDKFEKLNKRYGKSVK